MKRLFFLFIAMGIIISMQSCNKDGGSDLNDGLKAPLIPSTSLITIPTQEFGLMDDKVSDTRNDKSNWIHAGLNVLAWNTVVFVNTAIPIAAFGYAFEYEAEYLGDDTFEWKYEFEESLAQGGKKYDVSLTGQYISNNEEVAWTMTVTQQGTSNSFVWFEGVVDVENSQGVFTLNKSPQSPVSYMEISYERRPANEDGTIRYTNIQSGDAGNGDYIEWRTQNGETYDRAYDVSQNGNLLEIQGVEGAKNGRVKDLKEFGDEDWHCWSETRNNVDC